MVVFREKVFVLPLLARGGALLAKIGGGSKVAGAMNAASTGSMVGGLFQGGKQMKQAEQLAAQQSRDMLRQQTMQKRMQEQSIKEQQRMVNKAVKSGAPVSFNMPQPQQTTFSITLKRKTFANPVVQGITKIANKAATSKAWTKFKGSKTGSNILGFGKDLIEVGKKRGSAQKIADMTAMGATMAGGSYLVDKAIQADAKKSGIPIESEQPQEKKKSGVVKKAILGTGAAAGTLLLAKKGKLNTQTFKKGGKMLGEGFKNQFRLKDPNTGKKSILGPALTIGFPAFTGISYLTQKKQMKDQIEQSERQYSKSAFVRNLGKRIGNAGKKIIDAPAALMGFGKSNRQELSNQFKSVGINSGNPITMKVSKIVNPKNALLGTFAGIGVGSLALKPFDLGDKAVRKPLEKVDKKAYGYEKSQNQVV